jgi:hypothetical protein
MAEKGKKWLGWEDSITQLRQSFDNIKNAAVLDRLKGVGRMTEKEILMVQKGFPESTAQPRIISDWLKVAAKASAVVADESRLKAEWTRNNGDLTTAVKPFKAGGRLIPVGETVDNALRLSPSDYNKLMLYRAKAGKK